MDWLWLRFVAQDGGERLRGNVTNGRLPFCLPAVPVLSSFYFEHAKVEHRTPKNYIPQDNFKEGWGDGDCGALSSDCGLWVLVVRTVRI